MPYKWLPDEEDAEVETFPFVPNTEKAKQLFTTTPPDQLREKYLKFKVDENNRAVAVWKTTKKNGEETSYKLVNENYLRYFYKEAIERMVKDPTTTLPENGMYQDHYFDHRILSLAKPPPLETEGGQDSKAPAKSKASGKAKAPAAPKRQAQEISTSISTIVVHPNDWKEHGPKLRQPQLLCQDREVDVTHIMHNTHDRMFLGVSKALSMLQLKDGNQFELARKYANESKIPQAIDQEKEAASRPRPVKKPKSVIPELTEEARKEAEGAILPYLEGGGYVPCIGHPIWTTLDQDRLMINDDPETLKDMREIQQKEIAVLDSVDKIRDLETDKIEMIHSLMDSVYEFKDSVGQVNGYLGARKIQKKYVHDSSISITYERTETKRNGHCVKRTTTTADGQIKAEFIYCDFGKKDPNKKKVILAMMVAAYAKGEPNPKVSQDLMELAKEGSKPPEYIEKLGLWILALYDYLFGRAVIAKPKP